MHILASPVFINKLCSVTTRDTLRHSHYQITFASLLLKPDLQEVSIHSAIKFLYYSYTIKLLLLVIFMKWFYLSFKTLAPC
jgi:hypothetical protein